MEADITVTAMAHTYTSRKSNNYFTVSYSSSIPVDIDIETAYELVDLIIETMYPPENTESYMKHSPRLQGGLTVDDVQEVYCFSVEYVTSLVKRKSYVLVYCDGIRTLKEVVEQI